MPKKEVTVFVSYAHANKRLVRTFLDKFREQADASKRYKYKFWSDGDIPVGRDWAKAIRKVIKACDVGLMLVSPAFFGSPFITKHELPKFVGKRGKAVIPVVLQPLVWRRHDTKGLLKKQMFLFDRDTFSKPKAFGQCTGNQRDDFAQSLFEKVEERLDTLFKRRRR